MKVLHVLASNRYSGAENVVCQTIKMFENEVEMVYCSPNGPIRESLEEREIQFCAIDKLNKKNLKKIVNEFKPDVIHAHDFRAAIVCSKFYKQAKVVATIHGNKKDMNKLSIKSVIFNFFSRRINKIIWVSKSCFNDYYFNSKVKDKSIVLPNIISIHEILKRVDGNQSKHYDVAFLGRLVEEKNPTRLIHIANLITKKKKNFKMVIIGDGPYRTEMESLVKEYGIGNNIEFKGFLTNPFKILAESKVLLMTSIMEGTPMCCLESQALGLPIVSTKTDGLVELIENGTNGFLYDEDEEACEIIVNILKDEKFLSELIQNSKNISKLHNDESNYKSKLFKIYKG